MTQMRIHARGRTYARYVSRTLQARILMGLRMAVYIDIRNRLARFSERAEHDATVGSKGIDNRYINVATSLARYSDEYRTSVSPVNENVPVRRMKRTRAIKLIDTNGRTNCHVAWQSNSKIIDKTIFPFTFQNYNLVMSITGHEKTTAVEYGIRICAAFLPDQARTLFLSTAMLSPVKCVFNML